MGLNPENAKPGSQIKWKPPPVIPSAGGILDIDEEIEKESSYSIFSRISFKGWNRSSRKRKYRIEAEPKLFPISRDYVKLCTWERPNELGIHLVESRPLRLPKKLSFVTPLFQVIQLSCPGARFRHSFLNSTGPGVIWVTAKRLLKKNANSHKASHSRNRTAPDPKC